MDFRTYKYGNQDIAIADDNLSIQGQGVVSGSYPLVGQE
jgi:hypothetical protein